MVKATPMSSIENATADNLGEEMYGTLVSENTIGINHDHFLTFYMDVDVDGVNNTFVEGKLVRRRVPAGASPRRSYWGVERRPARTEEGGRVQVDLNNPSEYTVVNPAKKTRLGNAVGYRVVPGNSVASLMDPDDPPQRRAAFTENQVGVVWFLVTLKPYTLLSLLGFRLIARYPNLVLRPRPYGRGCLNQHFKLILLIHMVMLFAY